MNAEAALAQYQRAYDQSEGSGKDSVLVHLMRAAFAANQHETAREYAKAALRDTSKGWNLGNRMHYGNITLGKIALDAGKVEEAKSHLIAAGATQGSPQLNSFGPDMTLAKDLLEAGEEEAVLKYFELCSKFWKSGQARLAEWTELADRGGIPDFGRSLRY